MACSTACTGRSPAQVVGQRAAVAMHSRRKEWRLNNLFKNIGIWLVIALVLFTVFK